MKKMYGTFGVEMRAYGQKLVKFCTHTHAAKLVVEMYVEERVSIWIRSVCDPTFSSWACGDAVSPQWGRAESRWQTHIGNNLRLAENQVSDITCW